MNFAWISGKTIWTHHMKKISLTISTFSMKLVRLCRPSSILELGISTAISSGRPFLPFRASLESEFRWHLPPPACWLFFSGITISLLNDPTTYYKRLYGMSHSHSSRHQALWLSTDIDTCSFQEYWTWHSTGFQIWPLPILFLNSLRNNISWKKYLKRLLPPQKSKKCEIWYFAKAKVGAWCFAFAKCQILHFLRFCSCKRLRKYLFHKILFHKLFRNNIGRGQIWNSVLCEPAACGFVLDRGCWGKGCDKGERYPFFQ